MKKFLLTNAALTRWTLVVLVAAMTAGICGDAIAKTGKGHLHVRHLALQSYRVEPVNNAQARLVQAGPGPMRYYGGPKSPMWRGPVEN
jgi:hypothetical protein